MGFKSLVLILVPMALAIADKRTLDMSKPGKSLLVSKPQKRDSYQDTSQVHMIIIFSSF